MFEYIVSVVCSINREFQKYKIGPIPDDSIYEFLITTAAYLGNTTNI